MPERDTMHLRNKQVVGALFFLLLVSAFFVKAQAQSTQPQSQQGTQTIQPTPLPPDVDPNDPALPVWEKPATPPPSANTAKPGATGNAAANQPGKEGEAPISEGAVGEVTKNAQDVFTYRSMVNEVTLSATVVDAKRRLVTNLDRANFVVYEDGQPQNITSFVRKDIPVSIGIVVDNSGSMRTKRAALT